MPYFWIIISLIFLAAIYIICSLIKHPSYTKNNSPVGEAPTTFVNIQSVSEYIAVGTDSINNYLRGISSVQDQRNNYNVTLNPLYNQSVKMFNIYPQPTTQTVVNTISCAVLDSQNNIQYADFSYNIVTGSGDVYSTWTYSPQWINTNWNLTGISTSTIQYLGIGNPINATDPSERSILVVTNSNIFYLYPVPPGGTAINNSSWCSIYRHTTTLKQIWFYGGNIYFLDGNSNLYAYSYSEGVLNMFPWFNILLATAYNESIQCYSIVQFYVVPNNPNYQNQIISIKCNDTSFGPPQKIFKPFTQNIKSFQIDQNNNPVIQGVDNFLYTMVPNSSYYQLVQLTTTMSYTVNTDNTSNNIIWITDSNGSTLSQLFISMNPVNPPPPDTPETLASSLQYGCQNWSAWFFPTQIVINIYQAYYSAKNSSDQHDYTIDACSRWPDNGHCTLPIGVESAENVTSCITGSLILNKTNYLNNSVTITLNSPSTTIIEQPDATYSCEFQCASVSIVLSGDTKNSYTVSPVGFHCDDWLKCGCFWFKCEQPSLNNNNSCSKQVVYNCDACPQCSGSVDSSNCIWDCQLSSCQCYSQCADVSGASGENYQQCLSNCWQTCRDCSVSPGEPCVSDCPACAPGTTGNPNICKPCTSVYATYTDDVSGQNFFQTANGGNYDYSWNEYDNDEGQSYYNEGMYAVQTQSGASSIAFSGSINTTLYISNNIQGVNSITSPPALTLNTTSSNMNVQLYPDNTPSYDSPMTDFVTSGFVGFGFMATVLNNTVFTVNDITNSNNPSIFSNAVITYLNTIYRFTSNKQSFGTNKRGLTTQDSRYTVQLSKNLNIIDTCQNKISWSVPSNPTSSLIFQNNSNLVLISNSVTTWNTETSSTNCNYLILTLAGILELHYIFYNSQLNLDIKVWGSDSVPTNSKYRLKQDIGITSAYSKSHLKIDNDSLCIIDLQTNQKMWEYKTNKPIESFGWKDNGFYIFGPDIEFPTGNMNDTKFLTLTPIHVLVVTNGKSFKWRSSDVLFYNEILDNNRVTETHGSVLSLDMFSGYISRPEKLYIDNNRKCLILESKNDRTKLYEGTNLYALTINNGRPHLYDEYGNILQKF